MPIAFNKYDSLANVYTVQFKEGGPYYKYQGVEPERAHVIDTADLADVGKIIREVLVIGNPYPFIKVEPDQADSVA